MTVRQFNLPDPGEGLVEAEIVTWKVKIGDVVKVNDIFVEIETAKSLVELPVPFAGTVIALLVSEGDTVEVGTPIISIEDGLGGDVAPVTAPPASTVVSISSATTVDDEVEAGKAGGPVPGERVANLVGYGPRVTSGKRRSRKSSVARTTTELNQAFSPVSAPTPSLSTPPVLPAVPAAKALAKPPVRKLAKDLGVDLSLVTGSGEGGTVSRADVEAYAASGALATSVEGADLTRHGASVLSATVGRETRVPIKGVRKITAQAMVASAFSAPHVTEFITVDVTDTMKLVDRLKTDREFLDVKVSPLLIVAKALIIASHRHRGINATWDEGAQEIVVKNYVNLGIAAATPRGLIVPNIKDADQMSLRQLADALANLISTARQGKTQPAQMSGGSITITNVGVFGVDSGTPILNPGEAAILAFGVVRQMPWVVDGEIVARWVTQLSLSFDHRMVDGDLGSRFLADVAAILHDPSRALVWG
jgi:2-oxoisovalerate dehydrogenase E2 component (dihydrolipoyl transacylase)